MSILRAFAFFLSAVILLGALGLLLGADCLMVALIGLVTLVGLLQSIMGAESAAPHSIR
jgi:hypothetical protein